MDLTTLLSGLFGLLTAACLGFLAYGAWICLRHAARTDGVQNEDGGGVADTVSAPNERRTIRTPLALD